jgi:FAT domain
MWARGDHEKSLTWLRTFSSRLADDLGLNLGDAPDRAPEIRSPSKMNEYTNLLARCYLKQGQWQCSLKQSWNPVSYISVLALLSLLMTSQENILEILRVYSMATQFDPNWYKAWHTWALANFEVVGFLEGETRSEDVLPEVLVTHVSAAVRGLSLLLMEQVLGILTCLQVFSAPLLYAEIILCRTHFGFLRFGSSLELMTMFAMQLPMALGLFQWTPGLK